MLDILLYFAYIYYIIKNKSYEQNKRVLLGNIGYGYFIGL